MTSVVLESLNQSKAKWLWWKGYIGVLIIETRSPRTNLLARSLVSFISFVLVSIARLAGTTNYYLWVICTGSDNAKFKWYNVKLILPSPCLWMSTYYSVSYNICKYVYMLFSCKILHSYLKLFTTRRHRTASKIKISCNHVVSVYKSRKKDLAKVLYCGVFGPMQELLNHRNLETRMQQWNYECL
jgi:hypothetical protein